jgi:deoxyribose-phosphate aldolase
MADAGARATAGARDLLGVGALTNTSLTRWLHALPGVDQVGADARAAGLGGRSIKARAKAWAIDTAISMIDLTTLEGADTERKVRSLCAKATAPDSTDPTTPAVAAVCIYSDLVPVAVQALKGSTTRVAAVTSAFPAGRASLAVKLTDTRDAVSAGADEIDMVIDRGAFLSGRYLQVFEQIAAIKAACGEQSANRRASGAPIRLKVILETGELVTYDNVRRASWLAMLAGADFIKTSTGKVSPAATLPVTMIMLEAVRDWRGLTGTQVGVKPAGGVRTTKDAVRYLVVVNEIAGQDWLDPAWFRFGASSLLGDLLLQRRKLASGHYTGPDYVTID